MTPTVTKRSLSLAAAQALAAAALDHATTHGLRIAVAVVDNEGATLALLRMDGVGAPIAGYCQDKAYTAAMTGRPTQDFLADMETSPSLRFGLIGRERLLVWGGGAPVRDGDTLVGAVGVSGATEADDIACAAQATAAFTRL